MGGPALQFKGVKNINTEVDPHQPYLIKTTQTRCNAKENHPALYFNGMNMSADRIGDSANRIQGEFGRDIKVIPNDKEKNIIMDAANAVASSFGLSSTAEKEAFQNGKNAIRERLLGDKDQIVCIEYSHSTLIIKDIIESLKQDCKDAGRPDLCQELEHRIEMYTFGPATWVYPEGLKVKQNQHTEDMIAGPIAMSTSTIYTLQCLAKGELPAFANISRISTDSDSLLLPNAGKSHTYETYIGNNCRFEISRALKHREDERAQYIVDSIKRSEYSDKEYEKLVATIAEGVIQHQDPSTITNYRTKVGLIKLSAALLERQSDLGNFKFSDHALELLTLISKIPHGDPPKRPSNPK